MKPLASALYSLGWDFPDWGRGGERTTEAVGKAEVRYRDQADLPAAELLALEVQKNISSRKVVTVVRNPSITAQRELHIWVSQ
jgi:hypothetical protein